MFDGTSLVTSVWTDVWVSATHPTAASTSPATRIRWGWRTEPARIRPTASDAIPARAAGLDDARRRGRSDASFGAGAAQDLRCTAHRGADEAAASVGDHERRRAGGQRHHERDFDLGAAAYRTIADVRSPALELGLPWWTVVAVRGRRRGDDDESVVSSARAVEAYRGDAKRAFADIKALARATASASSLAHRGTRPRPAPGRGAARRGHRRPGWTRRLDARRTPAWCTSAPAASTPASSRAAAPRRADRDRPDRPARARPRTCAGCRAGGATQVDPLQLKPGDFVVHEQHGVGRYVEMVQRTVAGRDPRVPRHRVRAEQARPAGRPALRADRPARPGHPLRRRRGSPTLDQHGRRATGQKRKGRARKAVKRDRRRADPALRRAHGGAGPRVRAGHPVAARARGRVPVRRDARPAARPSTRSRPTWSSRSRWTG